MIHYDTTKLKKVNYSKDDLIEIIDRLQTENVRIARRKKLAEDEAWNLEGALLVACEKLEEYTTRPEWEIDEWGESGVLSPKVKYYRVYRPTMTKDEWYRELMKEAKEREI